MTEPAIARRYRLDGVISTVDAVNGGDTLDLQIESVKQAAVADRLLLTKTDLVDLDVLRRLQDRLGALNPAAPQIIAENGIVDPASLFDAGLYDPKTKSLDVQNWLKAEAYAGRNDHEHGTAGHGHAHQHSDVNRHDAHIKALCLTNEPIHGDALDLWLETLLLLRGADFLRTKGIINVLELDAPVVIHGVQHIFHPAVMLKEWPSEDRRSRIVFITREMDESALRNTLKMLKTGKIRPPKILPVESGDSDIATFEARR